MALVPKSTDHDMDSLTDAEFLRVVAESYAGEQQTSYAYDRIMQIAHFMDQITLEPPTEPLDQRNRLRLIPGGQKG